jgi:hypothetical protein
MASNKPGGQQWKNAIINNDLSVARPDASYAIQGEAMGHTGIRIRLLTDRLYEPMLGNSFLQVYISLLDSIKPFDCLSKKKEALFVSPS